MEVSSKYRRSPRLTIDNVADSGYSWHTNQYGLTIDTVEAFELVKPNGEVVQVTHESDPELFFALKVESFTLAS